jgi:hypothetical protein
VEFIGTGSTPGGQTYLVQEFCGGGTLKRVVLDLMLGRGAPYSDATALRWIKQARAPGAALQCTHIHNLSLFLSARAAALSADLRRPPPLTTDLRSSSLKTRTQPHPPPP